ncbi:hypothetical protein JTB14_010534 [Gonioctena quinquepunctata]|nr:hypothetical protein JTB14_010534 [Gonioctena quinquepunctata]
MPDPVRRPTLRHGKVRRFKAAEYQCNVYHLVVQDVDNSGRRTGPMIMCLDTDRRRRARVERTSSPASEKDDVQWLADHHCGSTNASAEGFTGDLHEVKLLRMLNTCQCFG